MKVLQRSTDRGSPDSLEASRLCLNSVVEVAKATVKKIIGLLLDNCLPGPGFSKSGLFYHRVKDNVVLNPNQVIR